MGGLESRCISSLPGAIHIYPVSQCMMCMGACGCCNTLLCLEEHKPD